MNLLFNLASLGIFIAIIVGVVLHHRVTLHVRIMKICFTLDVILLLLVEILRGAVEQVLGLKETSKDLNTTVLIIHIPFAVASLVWWIRQLVSGSRILRGRRDLLARHALNARIFLVLRLGNLVTAYMLY